MPVKPEEFRSLLKELRWANLFGTLSVVFVFFCLTNWKAFNGHGLRFGLRTSFREFLGWLIYVIVIVPLMGVTWWLLNKVDVRNVGFRIGSLFRSHADIDRAANLGE